MKELTVIVRMEVTKVIRMFDDEMADDYIQNLRKTDMQRGLADEFAERLEADNVNISNVKVFMTDIEED